MKQEFLYRFTACTAKASIALALCGTVLSGTAARADVYEADPRDEIKFETKRWAKNFIHIENGPIAVTTIKDEAWSSRWYLEPVGFGDFVRIQNRWTGCYLNVENGPMDCGTKDSGTNAGGRWSAQWRVVSAGNGDYTVVNRWTECRLATGYLKNMRCSKDNATAGEDTEYLWRLTNLTNLKPAPQPAPPAPLEASAPETPQISKEGSAVFLTTDGSFPSYLNLRSPETRNRLGGNFDEDIEAIDVYGQFTEVIGYEHPNFTGRTVTLRCGYYELIGDPENEISSIKVQVAVRPTRDCTGGTASSGVLIVSDGEARVEIHNWD